MADPEVKFPSNGLSFSNSFGVAKLVTKFFHYLSSVISHGPAPFDIDALSF